MKHFDHLYPFPAIVGQEQMIRLVDTEQHHGLALALPVAHVFGLGLDAMGILFGGTQACTT